MATNLPLWLASSPSRSLLAISSQKTACTGLTGPGNSTILPFVGSLAGSLYKLARRHRNRNNILNNFSCFPSNIFIPLPRPSPCHPHNKVLFFPFVRTYSHKASSSPFYFKSRFKYSCFELIFCFCQLAASIYCLVLERSVH